MIFDLQQVQKYSAPTAIFGEHYAELQSFYQYSFTTKKLSPQSWGLQENLTTIQKDELYAELLSTVGMVDQDLFFSSTLGLYYNNDILTIQKMGLSDSTFICDRRKGFSQINNATGKRPKEHKLTALSRRLRDSFAHGRIGSYGKYVLFEDVKNSITGRIVLEKDDILTWKRVIEKYIEVNNIPCQ